MSQSIQITASRSRVSNALELTAVKRGEWVRMVYFGYPKREALRRFREHYRAA